MKAAELDLAEPALSAALHLESLFPDIVFTSGRRSREDQARAMAQNIAIAGLPWLAKTYKKSPVRDGIAAAIGRLPVPRSASAIQGAISAYFLGKPDSFVAAISRHLSGLAFDIKPMIDAAGVPTPRGERVIAEIRRLPQLDKFLDHEGGLVRWHVQTLSV